MNHDRAGETKQSHHCTAASGPCRRSFHAFLLVAGLGGRPRCGRPDLVGRPPPRQTTGYNYLIQIIPTLIVAPLFIRGEVEFGVVTQSAMVFAQLLGAFSLIVNQFQSISSFAAVIARLNALAGAVEERPLPRRPEITVVEAEGRIAYQTLTLFSLEDGHPLLNNLTADIPSGTSVLVFGPNEGARRALFRATAGVWTAGTGTIVRPSLDSIFFLPQRPYLPPGTLRHLLRNGQERATPDNRMTSALHDVGLDAVLARAGGLDREHDWPAILSLGEQQLVALTRLILERPVFAMLDRVDATLKPAQVRQALRCLDQNSITYIALAEDAESVDMYGAVLQIDAGGAWSWRQIERDPRGDGQ